MHKSLGEVGEMKEQKHVKTVVKGTLRKPRLEKGCGECQVSCQSACKTSCTVGNQACGLNEK
jgi:predicted ribosomally synthesized six-cysteine peptide SCIFF